jgi:hypothetical protein
MGKASNEANYKMHIKFFQYEIKIEDSYFHLVYYNKINNYIRNWKMKIWDDIKSII